VGRPDRRGAPRLLGEGDEPAPSPAGDRVAFVTNKRIWIAPLDGSRPAEPAFFARGTSESPRWSPDGRSIAFVRMPGRGGTPRSMLRQEPQPSAIWIAAADGSQPPRQIWKSGDALVDSMPSTSASGADRTAAIWPRSRSGATRTCSRPAWTSTACTIGFRR
jgi:Tol biopolymer transport system component